MKHRISNILALLLCTLFLTASPAQATSIVVLQPRTPPNGRYVRHDIWQEPEAIWTCKIVVTNNDVIFDVCGYEDIFPQPEPPPWKRRLADKDAQWICIPNIVELSPIQAPFVKGLCLFAKSPENFDGGFSPNAAQLAKSQADYQRLMRARLAFDPAQATQNPEQAYYLKQQKLSSKRAIFVLSTLSNALEIASNEGKIVGLVHNALDRPIRVEIEQFAARASDPADPNYREIVSVVAPNLPAIQPDNEISPQLATALNQLRASLSQMIGLSKATLISLDRATGARQAGDKDWELRQLAAAHDFDIRYARIVSNLATQFAALSEALSQAGVSTTIRAENVVAWQNQLPGQAFTAEQAAELQKLGLNQAQIEEAAIRMAAQSPDEIEAFGEGHFPEMLGDPQIKASFDEFAAALKIGPIGAPQYVFVPLIRR